MCVGSGACAKEDFRYIREPQTVEENEWKPECFVCRSVLRNAEERLAMLARVNEVTARSILTTSCENMALSPEYDKICREMISGKLVNVNAVAWQVKNHGESMLRKDHIDVPFPEKICIDVKLCEVYIDKETKELEELKSMEAVYF